MRGRMLNFIPKEKRFSEQENWPVQQTWNPDHPQYYRVLNLVLFVLKKYHEINCPECIIIKQWTTRKQNNLDTLSKSFLTQ